MAENIPTEVPSKVVGGGVVGRIREALSWDRQQPSINVVLRGAREIVKEGEAGFESQQAFRYGDPRFLYFSRATAGDIDQVREELRRLGVDLDTPPSKVSETISEPGRGPAKMVHQRTWVFSEDLKSGEGRSVAVWVDYNRDEKNSPWRLVVETVGFPGNTFDYPIKVYQLKSLAKSS